MTHATNYDIYQTVDRLLTEGDIEGASAYLTSLIDERKASPSDEPITASKKKIDTVKKYLIEYQKLVNEGAHEVVYVHARAPDTDFGDIFTIPENWVEYPTYADKASVNSWRPFETDNKPKFNRYDDILKRKGFDSKIPTDCLHRVSFSRNVRFCNEHPDLRIAIDDENRVLKDSVARIAKILPFTLIRRNPSKLRRAIILPIPYSSKNYYHVISEMIYPLRTAAAIPTDCPIIYSEDHFNILPFFCSRLGINPNRLMPFSSAADKCISEALLISKSTHFWGPSFFKFFNWSVNLGKARSTQGKISYISRRKSSRSFSNEAVVEDTIRKLGGATYYLEEMSIDKQIDIFDSAELIIGSHGAGLTNIAFSSPSTKILEIFSNNFVHPDFYLRCCQNKMPYFPHIINDTGLVDIQELANDIELAHKM